MPRYLDHHKGDGKGVPASAVAEAHKKDLEVQEKYGVNYINYRVDEKTGDVFCLVDASSAESAARVHKEARGGIADEIHEVKQG